MNEKVRQISQSAIAIVNNGKAQYLEGQLLNAIDQVLELQIQVSKLQEELKAKTEEIDKNSSIVEEK